MTSLSSIINYYNFTLPCDHCHTTSMSKSSKLCYNPKTRPTDHEVVIHPQESFFGQIQTCPVYMNDMHNNCADDIFRTSSTPRLLPNTSKPCRAHRHDPSTTPQFRKPSSDHTHSPDGHATVPKPPRTNPQGKETRLIPIGCSCLKELFAMMTTDVIPPLRTKLTQTILLSTVQHRQNSPSNMQLQRSEP
ncbi:hypothetical protein M758_2G036700 [Ceratodon purpureus]|nr:hypothetical protein M758_2G036700 [Ceratodon purpureus]